MKKVVSLILCTILVIGSLAVFASAEEGMTELYLDYGNITVTEDGVSGYNALGQAVTEPNDNGYIITQKNVKKALARSVVVASGSHKIELKNINIARKGNYDFAVSVDDGATAEFILTGENTLNPGQYRAGIDISPMGTAIISGDGTLYTTSQYEAGIGGGNARSNGTVIINSGTIYATGGVQGFSAGIGGGTAGNGGNITINGGYIVAVGGSRASGIGGGNTGNGGNITINGGTVTATGGYTGAGIGGGYLGNGGNIVINGGSVKATAGENGETIGNGMNASIAFSGVHNANGEPVTLHKISLSDYTSVILDSATDYPICKPHENDDSLYLYLTAKNHTLLVERDSSFEIIKLTYANGAFSQSSVGTFSLDGYTKVGEFYLTENSIYDMELPQGFILQSTDAPTTYKIMYDGSEVYRFQCVERGDLSFDGFVNGIDALKILQYSVGLIKLNDIQIQVADMNTDGSINAFDALMILYKAVSAR